MKKLIMAIFGLLFLGLTETSFAQITGRDNRPVRRDTDTLMQRRRDTSTMRRSEMEHRKDTSRFFKKVDSTARVVGKKGAELGAKAVAGIRDCSLKNVKGPKGETVYVDENDRRYYINKEGKKSYLRRPVPKAGQ